MAIFLEDRLALNNERSPGFPSEPIRSAPNVPLPPSLQAPSPVLRGTRIRSRYVARSVRLSTRFQRSSTQVLSQRHSTYICHACTISQSIMRIMIRLLQFCPERTHSLTRCRLTGVYGRWSTGTENKKSTSPGADLPTDATSRTRSVLGGPSHPKGNASGFRGSLEAQGLGARVTRRTRAAPPRPKSPLTSKGSFVFRRHKSRGDPRSSTGLQCGQAIVRDVA